MDSFIALPDERRLAFLQEAEARVSLPSISIEKDFWVCWTLRELFGLPEWQGRLAFKGGTSLSKGWKLIKRFSEDIDVVISRESLGFSGDASPEAASSKKERKRRLDSLKAACQKDVQESLRPALDARFRSLLPANLRWSLDIDEDDADKQTLLFNYPSAFPGAPGYVRRRVKIEMGARSDSEPSEMRIIAPYLAEAFPSLKMQGCSIHTVAARRTFWEKAMLLHEENQRPLGKPLKPRLARHYYDIWCLIDKHVASEALADMELFGRIVAHREVFFNWSWVNYSTFRPGVFNLAPSKERLHEWRRDYDAMRVEMFFGEPPS